jgi:Fe/S biogenesis protein NfuA
MVLISTSGVAMIEVNESAADYFRTLIQGQNLPGLGIRLRAVDPGTPKGDCQLEFCEPTDLLGNEWEIQCEGFSLYVVAESATWLDGAVIDFDRDATGGQLSIKAPALRGTPPAGDASVVERVRYLIESEINPQLASHGGRVSLREVTAEGIVVLQFGGGCHGCGMVDVTLRNGIEKTLCEKIPEVTGVSDVTDHEKGNKPYYERKAG